MLQHSLLMQCESNPREEEIPSLFWGLDPVFLAFAKLYIRDILEMKESHQVPGIYIYNGHPIRRVDILGTVISVRERETFYSYGVDDATGVINCTCWKKLDNAKSSPDPAAPSTARELSMTSQLKKLQETMEQKTKIEIGDVIRVRGYVREFRKEREICATLYYKVDDPVWNIQIARMLELPALYKRIYDQPIRNPALKEEEALKLQMLTVMQKPESLGTLRITHKSSVESKNSATSSAIHSVFKNALQLLQEKGLVFQKDGGFDKPYYVTSKDKDLHQKIYKIIKEDCQRPNRKWHEVQVMMMSHHAQL
uniref:CST complex subunit STN1 n=1 Tax=Cricetulus griseus TaxID=10029 RepID=A0A8C2MXZ0_CRIGR